MTFTIRQSIFKIQGTKCTLYSRSTMKLLSCENLSVVLYVAVGRLKMLRNLIGLYLLNNGSRIKMTQSLATVGFIQSQYMNTFESNHSRFWRTFIVASILHIQILNSAKTSDIIYILCRILLFKRKYSCLCHCNPNIKFSRNFNPFFVSSIQSTF